MRTWETTRTESRSGAMGEEIRGVPQAECYVASPVPASGTFCALSDGRQPHYSLQIGQKDATANHCVPRVQMAKMQMRASLFLSFDVANTFMIRRSRESLWRRISSRESLRWRRISTRDTPPTFLYDMLGNRNTILKGFNRRMNYCTGEERAVTFVNRAVP